GRSDLQRRGARGRRGHRRDRSEPLVEVVGDEQRRVAERLELADGVGPGAPVERTVDFDAETEGVCAHDPATGQTRGPGGYFTGMCLMPAMKFERRGSASPV